LLAGAAGETIFGLYARQGHERRVRQLTRHLLEQVVALTSDAIIVIDAGKVGNRVVYVNPAFERLTGYTADEAVGHPWRLLDTEGDDRPDIAAVKAALGRSEHHVATVPDIRKDGTSWMSRIQVQPILNRRGELKHHLITQTETAAEAEVGLEVGLLQRELRRARQKVASLDRIDAASGVLRYDYFLEIADRDCRMARRDRQLVAVALFEINDLDAYQQTFGAKAAESCLRMIAAQVTGALRRAGDLCGCDDDKRLVALTKGQDAEEVARLAERIATNIRGLGLHNPRGRSGRYVTVRFGIAACRPSSNGCLAELIDAAHASLDPELKAETDQRSAMG
jgi:PAS domain S-box-containing protein/diguanylate cyclase (GGDEF)-like protein